jgi:hypothetical protein
MSVYFTPLVHFNESSYLPCLTISYTSRYMDRICLNTSQIYFSMRVLIPFLSFLRFAQEPSRGEQLMRPPQSSYLIVSCDINLARLCEKQYWGCVNTVCPHNSDVGACVKGCVSRYEGCKEEADCRAR